MNTNAQLRGYISGLCQVRSLEEFLAVWSLRPSNLVMRCIDSSDEENTSVEILFDVEKEAPDLCSGEPREPMVNIKYRDACSGKEEHVLALPQDCWLEFEEDIPDVLGVTDSRFTVTYKMLISTGWTKRMTICMMYLQFVAYNGKLKSIIVKEDEE